MYNINYRNRFLERIKHPKKFELFYQKICFIFLVQKKTCFVKWIKQDFFRDLSVLQFYKVDEIRRNIVEHLILSNLSGVFLMYVNRQKILSNELPLSCPPHVPLVGASAFAIHFIDVVCLSKRILFSVWYCGLANRCHAKVAISSFSWLHERIGTGLFAMCIVA